MKTPSCNWLFVFFLTLPLFCATNTFAAKIELLGIRHVVSAPGQEEVHLQLSAENEPHIWVTKENSARVVLDFPNTIQSKKVPNTINTQGDIVRRIRVGIHGNKARVVCDLPSLQGVKRDVRYDASSKTLVVLFTGSQTALSADKGEGNDRQTETATSPGPITNKKRSAIALQPPVKETDKAENATLAENSGEEASALVDGEEGNAQTAATPAVTPPGSSAAVIGGPSLFLPPEALASSGNGQNDEPTTASEADSEGQEGTAASIHDGDETADDIQDPDAPFLQSVSFQGDSPKGELVIFKLNGFYPPVVQGVEQNIPRIFCEFNDMTASRETIDNPVKPDKSRHVNSIRLQQQHDPSKIQAIVELEPGKSYDLQQVFFKKENMFVLIINEAKR